MYNERFRFTVWYEIAGSKNKESHCCVIWADSDEEFRKKIVGELGLFARIKEVFRKEENDYRYTDSELKELEKEGANGVYRAEKDISRMGKRNR